MQSELVTIIDQISKDKGFERTILIQALEQAILTAAQKTFGSHREFETKFDEQTGAVDLFMVLNIVEGDVVKGCDIALNEAHEKGLEAELGDQLLFTVFYRPEDSERAKEQDDTFGDLIDLKNAHRIFGRIAAQTAKQVLYQRVREAEQDNIYDEYKERKGDIIVGVVRRFERGNLVVDLGRTEAMLSVREQIPRESYRPGNMIKVYLKDIDRNTRGSQLLLSRTHKGLLEKLFETEVPEIREGIIRIESSAREPGARAKIAVSSRDRDVDPIGACVGLEGSRVQAVVQELRGEKIDIVPYDQDPACFVCNAIAPAEVTRVFIHLKGHRMELIVPDDKLSLAIGKKGQNVRLASQLTGWRIDIYSETKNHEREVREKAQIATLMPMSEERTDAVLVSGWRSAADLAHGDVNELTGIDGMTKEEAMTLIDSAKKFLQEEKKRKEEAKKEKERKASLSPIMKFEEIKGVDSELAQKLIDEGFTVESIWGSVKTLDALTESLGDQNVARRLKHWAGVWLDEVSIDEPEPEDMSEEPHESVENMDVVV